MDGQLKDVEDDKHIKVTPTQRGYNSNRGEVTGISSAEGKQVFSYQLFQKVQERLSSKNRKSP